MVFSCFYFGGYQALVPFKDDNSVEHYLSWQILKDTKVIGGIFYRIGYVCYVASHLLANRGILCRTEETSIESILRKWCE